MRDFRPKGIAFSGKIIIKSKIKLEEIDKKELRKLYKSLGKRSKLVIGDTFEYSYVFHYKLHEHFKTEKLASISLKTTTAKKGLYETDNDSWQELVDYLKSNIPEIIFYEDFIFEIPNHITFKYNTELADSDESKEAQWQRVLDDILKTVEPNLSSFQKYVVDIYKEDRSTAVNRISLMEKALNKKITESWRQLFDVEKSSNTIGFEEIKLEIIPAETTFDISFKVKTSKGTEFHINERSKGCIWFFSFLLFTEFRKTRTQNILFLLDEPGSNLHSSAQMNMLKALERLSSNSQIIYSTHSKHLIKPEWLGGARIVINDSLSKEDLEGKMTNDLGADIHAEKYFDYVGSDGLNHQYYFQPILEMLEDKPSKVDVVEDVVITEGKYDWYTFKYVNEVMFNNKYKLNFYPGKGATSNDGIIRLYLARGANFILILDSDPEGVESQRVITEEFGKYVKDKIVTYDDALNLKVVTEELFSEADMQKICDTAFGKGTFDKCKDDPKALKSRLNYSILTNLNLDTKVELEKDTVKTFEKVFEFLIERINSI